MWLSPRVSPTGLPPRHGCKAPMPGPLPSTPSPPMPAGLSTPSPPDIFLEQFSPWPKSRTGPLLRDYTRKRRVPPSSEDSPPKPYMGPRKPYVPKYPSSDEEEEDSCVQSYNYPRPNMNVLDVVILDVVEPCENLPDFEIQESTDFGSLLHLPPVDLCVIYGVC